MRKCETCGRKLWHGKHRNCQPRRVSAFGRPRITTAQVERNQEIYRLVTEEGLLQVTVARRYGISPERVRQLVMRQKDEDLNEAAFRVVREATGKNPAAVALGKLGASKGGKARAAKLSAKRRSEIARNAAMKRWRGIP